MNHSGAWACVAISRHKHGIVRTRKGERFAALPGDSENPALPSPRETELQREVDDLRERIKVLERITVDERQSRSVAAEIEALRDK